LKQLARKAGPFLRFYGLLQTVQSFHQSAMVWEPEGRRILVLAPHMDDETIGCGGALAKHARKGAQITVVFLTDSRGGSKTLLGLKGEERYQREQELMAIRRREAAAALEVLGVQEKIFLDAVCTRLASTPGMQQHLRVIIEERQPELVYLPFFLEENPDHRMVSQLLIDTMTDTALDFDCCGYEVWTALFPNCLVDIQDVVEVKRTALEMYRSQLDDKNYVQSALGLNAFRANALLGKASTFVEAFVLLPLADYRALHHAYKQENA
jgi:LmbE family N-acetylglucosaminyl deacetylase